MAGAVRWEHRLGVCSKRWAALRCKRRLETQADAGFGLHRTGLRRADCYYPAMTCKHARPPVRTDVGTNTALDCTAACGVRTYGRPSRPFPSEA